LVFVLAVAVVVVLAGATNFREIADHVGDLSQRLLARLGGQRHPLHREIVVPSEKRIRTRQTRTLWPCTLGRALQIYFHIVVDDAADYREVADIVSIDVDERYNLPFAESPEH
jgi:ribosomal protein S16